MIDPRNALYGEAIADHYDEWDSADLDTHGAVDYLVRLADDGPVLELGIGTGRVGVPLAERGVQVHGIEASPSMAARARAKASSSNFEVVVGDMTTASGPGPFSLVYAVFNTFLELTTADDQLRCLQNASAQLRPGGHVVIETFVPDVTRFRNGQYVGVDHVGADSARLDLSTHDSVQQRIDGMHVLVRASGLVLVPISIRYVYPSELDLMAQIAGLELVSRWSNWHEGAFHATSPNQIVTYRRRNNM